MRRREREILGSPERVMKREEKGKRRKGQTTKAQLDRVSQQVSQHGREGEKKRERERERGCK